MLVLKKRQALTPCQGVRSRDDVLYHLPTSPAATSSSDEEVTFVGEKPPPVAQFSLSNETTTTKRFNELAQALVQSDSKESNALSCAMHDENNPRSRQIWNLTKTLAGTNADTAQCVKKIKMMHGAAETRAFEAQN
jgi:hypothetical protein